VLRAAGETETAQGNIRDWLQLDEGEALGFSFSQKEEFASIIFLCIFISITHTILYTCFALQGYLLLH
jgi:hypothetical protein